MTKITKNIYLRNLHEKIFTLIGGRQKYTIKMCTNDYLRMYLYRLFIFRVNDP